MSLLSMSAIFTAARFRERQRVLENAHAYFSAEAETLGIVASRYYNVDNEERGHTRAQPEPFQWDHRMMCNVHSLLNDNIYV